MSAEIYGDILQHITEVATRESCMNVSKSFRQLCQEDFLVAEGMEFKPCEAIQACAEPRQVPEPFSKHDFTFGKLEKVEARPRSSRFGTRPGSEPEESYTVAVGTGVMRRACSRASNLRSTEWIHQRYDLGSTMITGE